MPRRSPQDSASSPADDLAPYVAPSEVSVPAALRKHLKAALPAWVVQRAEMPRAAVQANLAKANAKMMDPDVRQELVNLVQAWPEIRAEGSLIVIAGRRSSAELTYYAAAVINEIVLRYAPLEPLRTGWVGLENLHWLDEQSRSNHEAYVAIRERVFNKTLLLVENPLRASTDKKSQFMLEALYQHRSARKLLPTITTLRTDLLDGDWSTVETLLGPNIAERLMNAPRQILLPANAAVPAFG